MDNIINAYFADGGTPKTGLSPTIRIWEVDASSNTLVVNNDPMSEVGDGFYKYEFTTLDPLKDYLFRADSVTLTGSDRYATGATEAPSPEEIADVVLDEAIAEHLIAGSLGEAVSKIKADTTQLRIDVVDLLALATLLVKFQSNRTVIDETAKTMTIYDDDKVTPIHVFDLFDFTGTPSVIQVAERDPQ